jgi:hypothetical protein
MSITCSRCQAENNDTKFACWNCWAVLPRLLSEEDTLLETQKGKGNQKTSSVIEPINEDSLDITAIVPPQPEQKKSGLFGGFGKKKPTEEPAPIEELTDLFTDFEPEKMDTATTADTTENEDIFAPISDNVESPEIIEIAPEHVKEKKGLFGFGGKKATPAVTPEDTTLFPEKGEIPKPEKTPLFGIGKKKVVSIEPVQSIDIEETPDNSAVLPITSEITPNVVKPEKSSVIFELPVIDDTPIISAPFLPTPTEGNEIEHSITDDKTPNQTIETTSTEIINDATPVSDVPFDFDFKAEVEKIFGGTNQDSTIPAAPQPNKPKRIRPIREEDGGLKRPKRPQ